MSKLEQRISLRHLRLVDAIEREGSLARAAERLNMTQSAVTKGLQEAEALAGAPLFKRTSRGSIPTVYGQMLVAHARTVMAQLRRAARELDAWRDGYGSVAIGTLPSAAAGPLPQSIARAITAQPAMRVSLVEGQREWLTTLLRRGDLDLVVGRIPLQGPPDDIAQHVLGPDRAQLIVREAHPLTRHSGPLALRELLEWQWILPPPDMSLRRQIDTAFTEYGLEPPYASVESVSFLSNRSLLLEGDFIAVWPQHLAEVEKRNSRVAVLPVDLPGTERMMGVWWRRESGLSASARSIADALIESFPDSGR